MTRAVRPLRSLVDWRRALLLAPLLAVLGVAIYVFALRDTTAGTPRAVLLDTASPSGAPVGTTKGRVARDFQAASPEGEVVRLSALRGKPVIINFWATWCAACLAEMPALRDLQAEVGPSELHVLAMNVGEGSEAARRFLAALDAPAFRVGMDPTLVVADAYGVRGMPQSVFIDSAGTVRATYVGQLDEERLREYLEAATSGVDAIEREPPLRFTTTVARERLLEVRALEDGVAELRSKSLRCDDAYCARPVVEAIAGAEGVRSVEPHLEADPAYVIVRFDGKRTDLRALGTFVAEALTAFEDPLYTRPLDVRYE